MGIEVLAKANSSHYYYEWVREAESKEAVVRPRWKSS